MLQVDATIPLGGSNVSASGEGPLPIVDIFSKASLPSPRLGSTLPLGSKGGWRDDLNGTGFTNLPFAKSGQLVPHLVSFGFHITLVVFVDRRNDRNLVDDSQIEPAQIKRLCLFGIVGQQPDLIHPKIF